MGRHDGCPEEWMGVWVGVGWMGVWVGVEWMGVWVGVGWVEWVGGGEERGEERKSIHPRVHTVTATTPTRTHNLIPQSNEG